MSRSLQTSPRKNWIKILAWTLGSGIVLLVVAAVGVKAWINSYLRSPEFRQRMVTHSGEEMRAKVEIAPVQFSGAEFFSDGLEAQGGPEAKFSSVKIQNVRGEFSLPTIWQLLFGDGKFRIGNLDVQRVEASFLDDRIPLELPPHVKREHRGEVSRINVREVRFDWSGGGVTGMGATATPVEGGWQVIGHDGRVTQAGFPTLDLKSLRVVHKEPSLYIQEAKLREGKGEVSVTGEVTANEKTDLQVKVTGLSVTPLLPEDWRARLHGRLTGDARVLIPLNEGAADPLVVTGHAELAQGVLEALPILNKIADFTRTEQFRRLTLTQVRCDFRHDKNGLFITNLVLESERLISVKGQFTVANEQIDGTFDVGITPGPLQWLPGSQDKVFATMRDGYAWTKLRITGPVTSPKEDLSPRLYAAAEAAVVQKVGETATQAVGTAVDTVKKGATGVFDLLFGP